MEDFRARLQPNVQTVADVDDLLRRHQLTKAIRLAKRLLIPEEEMRPKIRAAARDMYSRCMAGVLLSAIFKSHVYVGYDADVLLRRVHRCRDYHGFLKQAERLKVGTEFADEVQEALDKLTEQGQVDQAAAWRRKFAYLKDEERSRPVV
jgi:hypothetical protein